MSNALIVVAGHTCLDVIPTLREDVQGLAEVLAPGSMQAVGPLVVATGGAVPNTGMALHRLGTPTRLVGKVGDDFVGRATLDVIRRHDPALAEAMIVAPDTAGSYTIILSAPGIDRTFLHYPGPNDTFSAGDVPDHALAGGSIFHFGYPPLMRRMYLNDGAELVTLLRRARERGLVTSLDVSPPDPDSEAGRIDWRAFLAHVLPYVDIFLPGVEEVLWMADPTRYAELAARGGSDGVLAEVDGGLLARLAELLLVLGTAIVGLKLGDQGLYLRTTDSHDRLEMPAAVLPLIHRHWLNRELLVPAFQASLIGTTGAGDCAVAGFLTGLLQGRDPDAVLAAAAAVGACNVEAADAVSGVPAWERVQQRITRGWTQVPTRLRLRGWGWDVDRRLWIGPRDRGGLMAADPR